MTNPITGKAPSRIILDLDRLLGDGRITYEEADRLITLASPSRINHTIANVLLIFGALMSVIGILALEPPLEVGLVLAILALGVGGTLIFKARDEWGLLGQTLVLMGTIGLSGWATLRFDTLGDYWPMLTAPFIAVLTIGTAIVFRNGVLAALAPLALANLLGTGTAYWHASYALFVEEATISIGVFGSLAAGIFAVRPYLPKTYELTALIMARVSFFLTNFAFWVGSLWGDYVGEMFALPAEDSYEQLEAFRAHALFIPDLAFSIGWLVFLIICIYVGLKTQRRFIGNTALVFLAIHFYTQIYETLLDAPGSLVLVGLSLVGFGFGLARFDRWQRTRFGETA